MTNKIMYFIANWKMYGNLKSLNTLDKVIKFSKSKEIKKGRLIYCPPNTLISSFLKKFENCLIDIGGQNCHESEEYGSHTGFVNSKMLKSSGANYVILGHSENRQKGETDKLINLKIKSAIKSKLKVIFCIGETFAEKKKKKTKSILSKQIKFGLKKIKKKNNQLLWTTLKSDLDTPVSTYLKLCNKKTNSFLLESVQDGTYRGRYSILLG